MLEGSEQEDGKLTRNQWCSWGEGSVAPKAEGQFPTISTGGDRALRWLEEAPQHVPSYPPWLLYGPNGVVSGVKATHAWRRRCLHQCGGDTTWGMIASLGPGS